jgi:hypothetical protein
VLFDRSANFNGPAFGLKWGVARRATPGRPIWFANFHALGGSNLKLVAVFASFKANVFERPLGDLLEMGLALGTSPAHLLCDLLADACVFHRFKRTP